MQYPHIVAQIDSYLARLIEARQLISALEISRRESPSTARAAVADSKKRSIPTNNDLPAPAACLSRLAPSVPHKLRTAALNKSKKKGRGDALCGRENQTKRSKPVQAIGKRADQERQRIKPTSEKSPSAGTPIVSLHNKVKILQMRHALNQPLVARPATALGGPIPVSPVFIPAEQVRKKQSVKRQEIVTSSMVEPASMAVCAEAEAKLLSRSWIQHSNLSTRLIRTT